MQSNLWNIVFSIPSSISALLYNKSVVRVFSRSHWKNTLHFCLVSWREATATVERPWPLPFWGHVQIVNHNQCCRVLTYKAYPDTRKKSFCISDKFKRHVTFDPGSCQGFFVYSIIVIIQSSYLLDEVKKMLSVFFGFFFFFFILMHFQLHQWPWPFIVVINFWVQIIANPTLNNHARWDASCQTRWFMWFVFIFFGIVEQPFVTLTFAPANRGWCLLLGLVVY
jgi:hypothetical protein